MSDPWLNRWNARYKEEAYAYGEEPNVYLKDQLTALPPGRILFGAEGEGRNAIFAATFGWTVSAFDISIEGKKKAEQLAASKGVSVDYRVGELAELGFEEASFDAIALIYAHFPPPIISSYHRLLSTYLKPGGHIILEAFGKNHLAYREKNPGIGGPPNLEALFSVEGIQADFPHFEVTELAEVVVKLKEGLYHNGEGSVVRFFGRKQ